MKIIIRGVIDWASLAIEEEDSYEYEGPIAHAKSSGSAPAAVDPYQSAGAQYGLSTGTANYNAGLNRVNQTNPLGGSFWSVNGNGPYQGGTPAAAPAAPNTSAGVGMGGSGLPTNPFQTSLAPTGGSFNYGHVSASDPTFGGNTSSGAQVQNSPSPASSIASSDPYASQLAQMEQQQAPNYTQSTQLLPWAQQELQSPIDTSGIAGMPGGPSTTQDLQNTQNALYNQQEAYIQPEQQIQQEQLQSQLANEGATPGSAAYQTEMDRLSRSDTFANNQAINSAITGGGAEQSRLFGLGSQSLQNQLDVRQAPISEYNALLPGGGGSASAQTPDISGAFSNQLSSQLAGYNANVASNNADTSAAGSLIGSYLMYLALA